MTSLHLDPSQVRPFESKQVRVLKSRARLSPSLDSSSKIEYESAKKCRVRVESMPSLDSDPSLTKIWYSNIRTYLRSLSESRLIGPILGIGKFKWLAQIMRKLTICTKIGHFSLKCLFLGPAKTIFVKQLMTNLALIVLVSIKIK